MSANPPFNKPKLVVVGGGLAGFAFLKTLLESDVDQFEYTLIDPTPNFLFKPMLYETLNGRHVSFNRTDYLQEHQDPVRVLEASALKLEAPLSSNTLMTDQGPITFDYLVLAPGATTNYFNVQGAQENSLPMLTMEDLDRYKDSIHRKLTAAMQTAQQANTVPEVAFEIIGGGPNGVELAFELKSYIRALITSDYPTLDDVIINIKLIEAMSSILPSYGPEERNYMTAELQKLGISVMTNCQVKEMTPDTIIISHKLGPNKDDPSEELRLKTEDPVWVTGVKTNLPDDFFPESSGIERFPGNGRVKVNDCLQVDQAPQIFVIGDAAGAVDPKNGKLLPATGQVGEQQAEYLAKAFSQQVKNPSDKRKPFVYINKGHMISMGPNRASVTLDFLPGPLGQLRFEGQPISWFRHLYYGQKIETT